MDRTNGTLKFSESSAVWERLADGSESSCAGAATRVVSNPDRSPDRKEQRIRALRTQALDALRAGDHRSAVTHLKALEVLDNDQPDWPRRAAECHRVLGDRAAQLSALERAATSYKKAGAVLKAVAVCKMMLALDPQQAFAKTWLVKLQEEAPASTRVADPALPTQSAVPGPARRFAAEKGLAALAAELAERGAKRRKGAAPVVAPPAAAVAGQESARVESRPPAAPAPSTLSRQVPQTAPPQTAPPQTAPPQVACSPPVPDTSPASIQPVSEPPLRPRGDSYSTLRLSEAPLSNVNELLLASASPAGGHGRSSGMFQLEIDDVAESQSSLALQQARTMLHAIPLFAELDPRSLDAVFQGSTVLSLKAGEIVYRQGAAPESLYVVVNGRVALIDEAASRTELYTLGENEFFGEASLLCNEPRASTVEAVEDCDLLAFDRATMTACVARTPAVISVLLRFLRERMIEHLLRTSPLFTCFELAERRSLSRRFQVIEMTAGAELISQGLRSIGLFVLLSGAVAVLRQEAERVTRVAVLERGGVFGQVSLLRPPGAVASVSAMRAGFALMLPRAEFHELIMTHPQFLEVVTTLCDERQRPVISV